MPGARNDDAGSTHSNYNGDSQPWNTTWVTAVRDEEDVCPLSFFEWTAYFFIDHRVFELHSDEGVYFILRMR